MRLWCNLIYCITVPFTCFCWFFLHFILSVLFVVKLWFGLYARACEHLPCQTPLSYYNWTPTNCGPSDFSAETVL